MKDNKKVFVQDYSAESEAKWTPKEPGRYNINFKVRDIHGEEKVKSIVFDIESDVNINEIGSSVENEAFLGQSIDLWTEATGNEELSYRFVAMKDNKYAFTQGYSNPDFAFWTPTEAGTYIIYYKIKTQDGKEYIDSGEFIITE